MVGRESHQTVSITFTEWIFLRRLLTHGGPCVCQLRESQRWSRWARWWALPGREMEEEVGGCSGELSGGR